MSCQDRRTRCAPHAPRRAQVARRAEFVCIFENIDEIWRFEPSAGLAMMPRTTSARRVCTRENGGDEPLSIPRELV
jgi:hypothetical protein